jgi:hypothetical protein
VLQQPVIKLLPECGKVTQEGNLRIVSRQVGWRLLRSCTTWRLRTYRCLLSRCRSCVRAGLPVQAV